MNSDKIWEKLGFRIAGKPASHGSGLYLRIPKKIADAHDLWTAEIIEFTVERALVSKKTQEVAA